MGKETLSQSGFYLDREQSLVKHMILQSYLERFAHKVGSRWDAITYVDCFSGPWNVRSQELKDSSFSIALEELRKARQTHQSTQKNLKLRCFFLEKDPTAHAKLKEFADGIRDAEIVHKNAALEDSVGDILKFVREAPSFPFIFIDPTGWTGFGMDVIAPLLRLDPGEVLINFMTEHIIRFIESPDEMTQDSFVRLFGSASFREKLKGLEGLDRQDAAVEEYAENVARTGKFSFTSKAIVLHREFDRTHFHLIYATRNHNGVKVFKEAEEKAMKEMSHVRAEARQRKSEAKTLQPSFFEPEVRYSTTYFDELRERYLDKAKREIMQLLERKARTSYDEAWALALKQPLVWESDLKKWIGEWTKNGVLKIDGLKQKQRVPKFGENHSLVWRATWQG